MGTYTYQPGAYVQPIVPYGYTAQQVGAALDTNHDGKVSQAEMAQADTNHDGQLSAAEVKQVVVAPTATYMQPVPATGSFVAYPTYTYQQGTYMQPTVPYGYTAQQVGAALDTNNDGVVSQAELQAADTNKDGKIDAGEIATKVAKKKKVSKKKSKGGCC